MTNIAILGFGVVGGGVADLIMSNKKEVSALGADEINIKYVLDARDLSGTAVADKVVRDFDLILADPEISVIVEAMGGSHPAYEYIMRALERGISVITSNKEVVARYGDEFLATARAKGVSFRFEAAVGGGIPVISPMISCLGHNVIKEVRGILNGTTNYILTKMFSYGESFESALADAMAQGYAEKDPTADVEGIDAGRKIAILGAIATGKLVDADKIYTEGITRIRSRDVKAAESIGCNIKLVGRCISCGDSAPYLMVAPYMVGKDSALHTVSGVYNAVEVIGEPIGNVMFYGQGAGAGATASAVVGDLMQIMRTGAFYASPVFRREAEPADLSEFICQRYISVSSDDEGAARARFGNVKVLHTDGEFSFLTLHMSEAQCNAALSGMKVFSVIRVLE